LQKITVTDYTKTQRHTYDKQADMHHLSAAHPTQALCLESKQVTKEIPHSL